MRGVCVDALNPIARPGQLRLKHLGLSGVRLVARGEPVFWKYHARLQKAGLETAIVLTGSSFNREPDFQKEAREYARKCKPNFWLLGNEFNIEGAASWPPGGDPGFVKFWREAAAGIREEQPEAKLWIGGMFSEPGLVSHALRLASYLTPRPAGVDIHPYLETTEEIEELLNALRLRGLLPIVMEWNWNDPGEIPAFELLLERLTAHSCWIPWDSRQLGPKDDLEGLVRGAKKTACGLAMQEILL